MIKLILPVFFAVFSQNHASLVSAGTISIRTQVTTQISGDNLRVQVSGENLGDEAAYNVQPQLEIPGPEGQSISGALLEQLSPQKPHDWEFKVPLKLQTPGRYSVALRVHYTDANHYPFSALSVSQIVKGADVSSGILTVLSSDKISNQGKISLRIKNLEPKGRSLQIRWFLPAELSIQDGPTSLNLASSAESEIKVKIKNFAALPGSAYPIFAILDYDQDGRHVSAVASGQIGIVPKSFLEVDSLVWVVLIVIGLAAFVGLNLFKGRK